MAIAARQTDLAALLAAIHWGTDNAQRKEISAGRAAILAAPIGRAELVIVAASATGEGLAIAVDLATEEAPVIAVEPESVIDPGLEEVEVWGAAIAAAPA